MRFLIVTTIFSLFFVPQIFADEASNVKKLTKERIDIVINLLRQKDLDKETRNKKIIATVNPLFDFGRMAKLSLGKKHWVSMNKEQQKEFINLFSERLQISYLEKLDLYTDEKVVVEEATQVKKRIHVLTRLVSKTDKKDMIYKFYKSKKGWKVYDVEILGVSVVQTYRSQFNGLLKKGTIDDLLTKLKISEEFNVPTEVKDKK